eukprot:gene48837-18699_t
MPILLRGLRSASYPERRGDVPIEQGRNSGPPRLCPKLRERAGRAQLSSSSSVSGAAARDERGCGGARQARPPSLWPPSADRVRCGPLRGVRAAER